MLRGLLSGSRYLMLAAVLAILDRALLGYGIAIALAIVPLTFLLGHRGERISRENTG